MKSLKSSFFALVILLATLFSGSIMTANAARYYDEPSGIQTRHFHHYYTNNYDNYYSTPTYTVTYPSVPTYFAPSYYTPSPYYYDNSYTSDRTISSCQREYGIGSIPNTSGGCKCSDDYQWNVNRSICEPLRRSYQNRNSCTYRTYYGPSQWVESSYPCVELYR